MKYIDLNLSPANTALLVKWIERRETRCDYPDVRRDEDRRWWEAQQAFIRFAKNPPKLELRNFAQEQQQALNAYNHQSAMNANHANSIMGIGGWWPS